MTISLLTSFFANGQAVVPEITGRVDTSKTAVKEVYNLYKGYINSKIDSTYANPYWNLENYNLADGICNKAIEPLLTGTDPDQFLKVVPPKILQIDSIAKGRYQIKTLFAMQCPDEQYKTSNPVAITKLYAVRNYNDKFKLENSYHYDTRSWKHKQVGMINYTVSPTVNFKTKRAIKANEFCKEITSRFDIEEVPSIDFYLTSNSDEMMKLFNFEYILSYHKGLTLRDKKEIYSAYGDPLFKHELVHMFLSAKTMIMSEGVATWLAGPGDVSYKEALRKLSRKFQKRPPQSLEEIINSKYRNQFNNNVIYVTGAVICQMAYDINGIAGVKTLLNSDDEEFKKTIEKVFSDSFNNLGKRVIKYIKEYDY